MASHTLKKVTNNKIYRVLDANINRAKEGLRTCEDTARFILNDETLAKKFKKLRHDITGITKEPKLKLAKIIRFRDTTSDFGKKKSYLEKGRKNISDVFAANFQRAKEAVRVLEEFSKLIDKNISDKFKCLRFRLYSLEKRTYTLF